MRKKTYSSEDLRKLVYRTIASAKNKRRQVAIAKDELDAKYYPEFIKIMYSNHSLRNEIVMSEFPEFGNIKKLPLIILNARNIKNELIWVASILRNYSKELQEFVILKNKYYEFVYSSNVEEAENILNEIESKFGYSLWLIRSKIYIYKEKYGQKRQQEYVENLVENKNYQNDLELMQILNYSNAMEDNKDYQEHKKSILEIFDNYINIKKNSVLHTIFRIVPEEILDVEDLYNLIAQDEIKTIIDRYESFIFSLVWSLVNETIDLTTVQKVISIFSLQEEKILRNIELYIEVSRTGKLEISSFTDYNLYTSGDYEIFLKGNYENINLSASALANLEDDRDFKKDTLIDRIILSIRNVFLNKNQHNELEFLHKNNLINFGSYYSYQILSVLQHLSKDKKKKLEKLIFVNRNPKSFISILNDFNLKINERDVEENISLALLYYYGEKNTNGIERIKNELPICRYNNYLGLVYLHNNSYEKAKNMFDFNMLNGNSYTQKQARINLLETFLKLDEKIKILELFAEDIVNNGFVDSRYDVLKFFKENFKNRQLYSEVNFSIIVDYLKKNKMINYLFDINLSDLMEYVLEENGIEKPSEFFCIKSLDFDSLITYYLRNICAINVMDSLLVFDTQDDVENERILICQKLINIDSKNSNNYRSEIALLTKNMEVNKLFNVVETGRIYVDTDGIKALLWDTVSKSLMKCKEALNSPNLEFSTKFKNILNNIYKDQYPVLKGVYLPENETEEFYFNIVRNVIDSFYFNPAYGLDTNISTAIRHGWLGGYITAPLLDDQILLSKQKGKYVMSDFWKQIISIIDSKTASKLEKDIISFSNKLNNTVNDYLENKLQISNIDSMNKNSLFNIFWTKDQHNEVIDFITEFTTTDEIIEKIFSICWNKVEENLFEVRLDLRANANIIKNNLDKILTVMSDNGYREQLSHYVDTIVNAREKIHENFETIEGWFFLTNDLGIESFELDNAFLVCKKQIENCYGHRIPEIKFNSEIKSLPGLYFEGLCKILFLLIQNVIIHNESSFNIKVDLSVLYSNNTLSIACSNPINESSDFQECRNKIEEAQNNLTVNRARVEGGSGLSKIKVIAEFDFKKSFDINLNLSPDRIFSVRINVSDMNDISD